MSNVKRAYTKLYPNINALNISTNIFSRDTTCGIPDGIYSLSINLNNFTSFQLPSSYDGKTIYIFLDIKHTYTWYQIIEELKYKINAINNNQVIVELINFNTTINDPQKQNKQIIIFVNGIKITSDLIGLNSYIKISNGPINAIETLPDGRQITNLTLSTILSQLGNNFKGDFITALNNIYPIIIENGFENAVIDDNKNKFQHQERIFNQPEHIPQWTTLGGGDILRGNLVSRLADVQKSLNRVNILLDKGDELLSRIQTYVNLIKRIETALNRGIYIFLDALINYIQNMLNAIKSTGIYVLDLTSYHIQPTNFILDLNANFLNGEAWYTEQDNSDVQTTGQITYTTIRNGTVITEVINIPIIPELNINNLDLHLQSVITAIDRRIDWRESQRFIIKNIYRILANITNYFMIYSNTYRNTWNNTNISYIIELRNIYDDVNRYRNLLLDLIKGKLIDRNDINALNEWIRNKIGVFSNILNLRSLTNSEQNSLKRIGKLFSTLGLMFNYKPETYYEFIDVICDAFTDIYDMPAPNIINTYYRRKELDNLVTLNREISLEQKLILSSRASVRADRSTFASYYSDYFKSGRPQYPAGMDVTVHLWVFVIPDFMEVFELYNQFKSLLSGRFFENFNRSSDSSSSLIDFSSGEISFGWREYTFTRGEEPNFYGITLNQVMPEVFSYIDNLLTQLRSISLKVNFSSILDPIDGFINWLKDMIFTIKGIIELISKLLRLIVQLITFLGKLYHLEIKTQRGNYGIIEQLKSAKSFFVSIITTDMILKEINLTGNEIASIDADNKYITSRDFISNNNATPSEQVDRVKEYIEWIKNTINEIKSKTQGIINEINLLNNYKNVFYQLITQINNLYASQDWHDYQQYINNFNTELANKNSEIKNLEILYDAYINNVYHETDNPSGYKNRKYIDNQINYYIFELSNESSYNIAYYAEYNRLQTLIDKLDEEHNNPNMPQNPNYDIERAELVNKQNILTNQKNARDIKFTNLKNKYIEAKNTINTFLNSITINDYNDLNLINNKIIQLQDELENLKNARELEYNNFLNNKQNKENQISANNITINANYILIGEKQANISAKNAQITYIQETQLNPAIQDRYNLCPKGSDCTCPLSRTQLDPSPPCALSDPEERAQMLVIMNRILDAQEAIQALQDEITILQQDIDSLMQIINNLENQNTQLQNDIEQLIKNMNIYDETNYLEQLMISLQISALMVWHSAEYTRITLNIKQNAFNLYKYNMENTITIMYDNLLHLYIPIMFNNDYTLHINYLKQYGFDTKNPNNEIVNNVILKIDNILYIKELEKNKYNSIYNELEKILKKIYADNKLEEKLYKLKNLAETDIFDPNEKMYYGGVLYCWGLPIKQDETSGDKQAGDVFNPFFNAAEAISLLANEYEMVKGDIQITTGKTPSEIKEILQKIFGAAKK